jgi:pilus assembly protein Flp/PilA
MVSRFLVDDSGQGLVEYSMVIAMVSLVALASLNTVGKMVSQTFSIITGRLS